MAGQNPNRRELVQALALASVASAFPGFTRWTHGQSQTRGDTAATYLSYKPLFFTSKEYAMVEVLAELVLPATHHSVVNNQGLASLERQAGASDAGVAEFVDFMVATDAKQHAPFREGLAWMDRAAAPESQFIGLPAVAQNALLERLAYKAKQRSDEQAGQQFFRLFRRYVVMGFYTTELGLKSLDYPGLTFYGTSPGCNHSGNPEHSNL